MVSRELVKSGIEETLLHTGQHYDANMSQHFFEELELPFPAINLNIHPAGHSVMTGRMIEGISAYIKKLQPDAVLVYGDCNSTLAGAIAAKQEKKVLLHVEAGLRSYRSDMPEELNRIITDRISDFLFCPTRQACSNLQKEGFDLLDCQVILTGDVMEDAALFYSKIADQKSTLFEKYPDIQKGQYLLCTFHREENISGRNKLSDLCMALRELSRKYQVVIPLHPATRKQLEHFNLTPEAYLLPPLGYLDMNILIRNAKMVITDSGGLQREAFFFNKFCVVLREETEWGELAEGGYSALTGSDTSRIFRAVEIFEKRRFRKEQQLFGEGNAAQKIAACLKEAEGFAN
jgi:UDP-GlcNAc3NAcA epimerase